VWCAAGFVLYTREIRGQRRGHENHAAREPQSERPLARRALQKIDINDRTAVVIEDAGSDVTMWDRLGGLPIGERVVRAAARAGYGRVIVWAPRQQPGWLAIAGRGARDVHLAAVSTAAGWGREMSRLDPHIPVTLFSSSVVPSPALLDAASAVSPKDRVVEVRGADGRPGPSVYRTRPEHLASPAAAAASVADARHRERIPFITVRADPAIRIPRRSDLPCAERQLRAGIIKATDGRVGRFNRRLSIPVSVALITWTRFNAHVMSVLLIVLGLYAGWLFSVGHYTAGVLAALISLAASILDGCDGELARLQYRESAFGCWLDTMGDYTYYLAIFTGLTAGAARRTGWTGFWWIGAALLCGTVLTFALLILLRERITAGRPEQLRSRTDAHFHARGKRWTRLAANLSTCATRATMPYGILAFAIADALSALVVLAAFAAQVYWISLAVELRRLLAGGYPPVRSTLDPGEPASSPGGI
jgi:phosphatidylglycerophosphate synthase